MNELRTSQDTDGATPEMVRAMMTVLRPSFLGLKEFDSDRVVIVMRDKPHALGDTNHRYVGKIRYFDDETVVLEGVSHSYGRCPEPVPSYWRTKTVTRLNGWRFWETVEVEVPEESGWVVSDITCLTTFPRDKIHVFVHVPKKPVEAE